MAKLALTKEYVDLVDKIEAKMNEFSAELEKPSKASLKRARKISLELAKLYKEFRKISVHIDLEKK